MTDVHGLPVVSVANGSIQLDCLAEAGPRIVRAHFNGSDNLLAEVPDFSVPTPLGDYRYLGGHRLWHSPEAKPRTYVPDDRGLTVTQRPPRGLILEGKVESPTGIRKRIEIELEPEAAVLLLTHTLTNEGLWPVELSPWAITMLRLGGTGILPLRAGSGKEGQLLPDRHISLWSYTHVDDPRLRLLDEFALVRPKPEMPPLKIGTYNPVGWTAYWRPGVLMRKSFTSAPGPNFPDHGCNSEIYCDGQFIELESLGPLTKLEPGSSVVLNERWEFFSSLEQDFIPGELRQLLSKQD